MKLAVMQPYFFPYLGYFQLIHSVDRFIFFDDVQYVKKSWMSRNRLRNFSSNKPFYIRPALEKVNYKDLLIDIKFQEANHWKERLKAQMGGYKNKAPYYRQIIPLINEILSFDTIYLSEFNIKSIIKISDFLDLNVEFEKYSNYHWNFPETPGKGEWGLRIAIKSEVSHYINSPGGENFIFSEDFQNHNIKLGFIQPQLSDYNQNDLGFIPGLSIIDVLFFNGKEGTIKLIEEYRIKWKN